MGYPLRPQGWAGAAGAGPADSARPQRGARHRATMVGSRCGKTFPLDTSK